MLAPKDFLDALSGTASRLFNGDTPLPKSEIESQFKALLQSAFSKLDLVSREEFDSQMVVLARTRARLESLEAKVAELEAKLTPPAEQSASPVGAAEGCDLLISSPSTIPATSYNLHHRRPIAPKSPGF